MQTVTSSAHTRRVKADSPVQVRRLHETFHEPFRKTLRQSQLRLTPSTAAQDASAAMQPSSEMLPVDLVIPLDPDQDQDDDDDVIDELE